MKRIVRMSILPLVWMTSVSAVTINEALIHMINTNPEIRERIENYRAIEQDKKIAFSDYLPVLDAQGGIGKKRYDSDVPAFDDDDWTYTEAFIRVRENLFHGFGHKYNNIQQDKRLVSAEYYLMEKVSQLGLDLIEKYLEVLKTKQLLDLAIENKNVHQDIYNKIKQRTQAGAGSQADMEQIAGRLALAQSNVIVAENNFMDAKTNFFRIYGEILEPSQMKVTDVNTALLPTSLKEAEELALRQYPSLLTMKKNVEALEAGYHQAKENYYPWVDLEIKQEYTDNSDSRVFGGSIFAGQVNQTSAMVIASWNLYNGGADTAQKERALARMFEELERMHNTKRLVIERLKLSWAALERLREQVKFLKKHRDYTKKTLEAYKEEFNLGRRTLLDVLDVENEYYTSRKAYVSALFDEKFAKYRVIENVGNLPRLVSITSKEVLKLKRNKATMD